MQQFSFDFKQTHVGTSINQGRLIEKDIFVIERSLLMVHVPNTVM
ncbi:hypothetical protein [Halobacillus kuroshimensis]|nr:hypothetical protein [Halobacillus kuroshimensis]